MRRNFPSLASDQYAYCFDSESDFSGHAREVSSHFKMFQTLGDGMTAHSPAWPITRENMVDYLFSLAAAMLDDADLRSAASYEIRAVGIEADSIEFARTVLYKEIDQSKKFQRRYYSIAERKISMSESKRHDKRYEEVPRWADGEIESVQRLLWQDHYDGIRTFALMHAIAEHFRKTENRFYGHTASLLNWKVQGQPHDYDTAYEACLMFCRHMTG